MTLGSYPRKRVMGCKVASSLVSGTWGGLLLTGALLAGCGGGKSEDRTNVPSVEGKRAEGEKTVAETPVAASSSGGSVKKKSAPAATAMPDDVPIYVGAMQTNATQVGSQAVAGYKTSDPHATVISFYTEKLPANGWTIDKNDAGGLGATMHASKEGRKLTVAVTRALPQGAVINLSHRP